MEIQNLFSFCTAQKWQPSKKRLDGKAGKLTSTISQIFSPAKRTSSTNSWRFFVQTKASESEGLKMLLLRSLCLPCRVSFGIGLIWTVACAVDLSKSLLFKWIFQGSPCWTAEHEILFKIVLFRAAAQMQIKPIEPGNVYLSKRVNILLNPEICDFNTGW